MFTKSDCHLLVFNIGGTSRPALAAKFWRIISINWFLIAFQLVYLLLVIANLQCCISKSQLKSGLSVFLSRPICAGRLVEIDFGAICRKLCGN